MVIAIVRKPFFVYLYALIVILSKINQNIKFPQIETFKMSDTNVLTSKGDNTKSIIKTEGIDCYYSNEV